jgi:hypothetical protein
MQIGQPGGFSARWFVGPALLVAWSVIGGVAQASGPDPVVFRDEVRPFLARHCLKYHGPTKAKGGLDFSKLEDEASVRRRRKVWRGVVEHGL